MCSIKLFKLMMKLAPKKGSMGGSALGVLSSGLGVSGSFFPHTEDFVTYRNLLNVPLKYL